jgi:DNA polymerase-3 subunit epsilon
MIAVCFDFETTGLTLHPLARLELQPRAIEFGGVLIDNSGTILETLSLIIDPEQEIEPIITKITGLTNDDLRGKPKFKDVFSELNRMFAAADLMVAHNLPFDTAILDLELQRMKMVEFAWPRMSMCTVQSYMEQWGRRPKLTELYEHVIGRPLLQTHRASDDATALAEIVIAEGILDKIERGYI